jgi:hypothetical protein
VSIEGWYFGADMTPLHVTRSPIAVFRCIIPVLPGGDGAATALLSERTARCDHATTLFVGQAATCAHHLRMVFGIARVIRPPIVTDECVPWRPS